MERSAKHVLQGAALATLLLGAQSSAAQPVIRHELSFDEHGRLIAMPVEPTQEPGDDQPPTWPNIKC